MRGPDLIRYTGGAWQAVSTGYDLAGATLIADMPELVTRAIEADADGAIWAATDGAGVYRLLDGVWSHYGKAEGVPSDVVLDLAAAASGAVWVATPAGVAVFDGSEWSPQTLPAELGGAPPFAVVAGGDTVWVATSGGLASSQRRCPGCA